MKKSLELKLQKMAYNNRGLSKKLGKLKKSWDEVNGIINGGNKKKKKE